MNDRQFETFSTSPRRAFLADESAILSTSITICFGAVSAVLNRGFRVALISPQIDGYTASRYQLQHAEVDSCI